MMFHVKQLQLASDKRRRPRLESLEHRMVLSTVHGVSASQPTFDDVSDDAALPDAHAPGETYLMGDGLAHAGPCVSGAMSLADWADLLLQQALDLEEESPEEELDRLRNERDELEQERRALEKEAAELGREFDENEDKLADDRNPPSMKELERLKKRQEEINDRYDEIEERQDAINEELDRINERIGELAEELAQDQDGDGLSDDAQDASVAGAGSLLSAADWFDVCGDPDESDAVAVLFASQAASDAANEPPAGILGLSLPAPAGIQSTLLNNLVLQDFFRRLAAYWPLVQELGDDRFAVREEATRDLIAAGEDALPIVQLAQGHDDPEVVVRSKRIATQIARNAVAGQVGALVDDLGSGEVARQRAAMQQLDRLVADPDKGELVQDALKEAVEDAPASVQGLANDVLNKVVPPAETAPALPLPPGPPAGGAG